MKTFLYLSPCLLFSSCSLTQNLGTVGIVLLFAVLIVAMIAMAIFVARKKKNADNTAAKFSNDVKQMIDKIGDSREKIIALDKLIERINKDEKYKKDVSWRNTVLSKVLQQKATVYYQMGKLDKIIEVCTSILEVEPNHMMSYYNRGTIYSNKGQYEKAIKDLTDAISLDVHYIDAYNNRGFAYSKMKDYVKALADFDYVIALAPGAITYYNRGNVFKELNEYEKAFEDYTSAQNLDDKLDSNISKELLLAIQELKTTRND